MVNKKESSEVLFCKKSNEDDDDYDFVSGNEELIENEEVPFKLPVKDEAIIYPEEEILPLEVI
jgi:hypothetical protein